MAKPVSEEEVQLNKRARRRLIGAIALVAVVAAILPMVLDSEPKPTSGEVSIRIPPPTAKDGKELQPAPAVAAAPKAPEMPKPVETKATNEAKEAKEAKAVGAQAVETPPAKPPQKAPAEAGTSDKALARAIEKASGRSETGTDKAPPKQAEQSAPAKAAPGSFYIQVMALSDADKARQTQQKLQKAGVRAYTEVVAAASGRITRVRAGPFASREEADKAQSRLQGMGFEGRVASYQ